jgi:hypothetical protein
VATIAGSTITRYPFFEPDFISLQPTTLHYDLCRDSLGDRAPIKQVNRLQPFQVIRSNSDAPETHGIDNVGTLRRGVDVTALGRASLRR